MNKNKCITFEFSITEKEFTRFSLYIKMKYALQILTGGFFLLMIYFFTLTNLSLLMNFIVSALCFLLLEIPLVIIGLIYKAKKEFKSNRSLREKISVEIDYLGVNLISKDGRNHRDWNSVYSVRELKKDFVVYYSESIAYSLPKEYFNSKKDINLFKKFVLEHLNTHRVHFKN